MKSLEKEKKKKNIPLHGHVYNNNTNTNNDNNNNKHFIPRAILISIGMIEHSDARFL